MPEQTSKTSKEDRKSCHCLFLHSYRLLLDLLENSETILTIVDNGIMHVVRQCSK